MLATFVIGLREGLEAALIVGIIATFLRSNGRRLTPMWIGVVLAVLISIAVGVVLRVVETSLPQAAQEGMETVIGAVAIVFVTGMVLWMATHARYLKRELESAAEDALGDGTSRALAVMAFLAVLKEGFETAVFLLATFQAASNATAAAGGAVLGVLVAALIGLGIFRGGVRLNLGRFFKITSAFLVLVAAGLVLTALRTAHEAHWLNAGQQRTVDLHWLAPNGSIRGALFTGVLGIPPDPRVVEVLGWFCYLVPMALMLFWPQRHRPGAAASRLIKTVVAGVCVVGAVVLFVAVPAATLTTPTSAALVDSGGKQVGTARLLARADAPSLALTSNGSTSRVTLTDPRHESHGGLPAIRYVGHPTATGTAPDTITLEKLISMTGNRLPVGFDPSRNPGPFTAHWSRTSTVQVWSYEGHLLDATGHRTQVVTLTGGGLTTARTMSVAPSGGVAATSWSVSSSYTDRVGHASLSRDNSAAERDFWRHVVPIGLLVAAAALLVAAWWSTRSSSETPTRAKAPAESAV